MRIMMLNPGVQSARDLESSGRYECLLKPFQVYGTFSRASSGSVIKVRQ